MLGTRPVSTLAPLDYRYALDAAMPVCAKAKALVVLCRIPQLMDEVRQRIPHEVEPRMGDVALWVEPLAETWRSDLTFLADRLADNGQFVAIVSRPLATILPERQSWGARVLGVQPGGIRKLCSSLSGAGFMIQASYGIHTAFATGLNLLSQQMERWGRPDLGDRLQFAARLHYCTTGLLAALSTVALLFASKEQG